MTYSYRCNCGWRGDISCPVNERDNQFCPVCGARLVRLLSRPHFFIPRHFVNAPSDEEIFTPLWQPVKYNVSKKELMKEYDKAIEDARKQPDWLKRVVEEEHTRETSSVGAELVSKG